MTSPNWSEIVAGFTGPVHCSVFTDRSKSGRKSGRLAHCQGSPPEWVFYHSDRPRWDVLCEHHCDTLAVSEGWSSAWRIPAPLSAADLLAALDMLWEERWFDTGMPHYFYDTADFKAGIRWNYGSEDFHRSCQPRPPKDPYPRNDAMPKTQIFKHGEDISVVTTASEERDFLDSFTEALRAIMAPGSEARDQREAVRAGFDIVAKLRGYKNGVHERRVLAAGRWPHPSEQPVSEAGSEDDGTTEQGEDG